MGAGEGFGLKGRRVGRGEVGRGGGCQVGYSRLYRGGGGCGGGWCGVNGVGEEECGVVFLTGKEMEDNFEDITSRI